MVKMKTKRNTMAKDDSTIKNRTCQRCAYFKGKHADLSSCRHYEIADGRVIEAAYERPYGICRRYHEVANTSIRHVELEDVEIS